LLYVNVAGVGARGKASSGKVVQGSELAGEAIDKVDETWGLSRTLGFGLDKPVEETRAESKVAGSDGKARSEAESAEEGEITHTRGVEGVGQAVNQFTLQPSCAGAAVGGISGSERGVGGTELAGEVVVYGEKPVQQSDMGKEREVEKNLGEVARADTVEEWGELETLEIQPLAIMGAGEHQSEA
jgi:hypothetical protein